MRLSSAVGSDRVDEKESQKKTMNPDFGQRGGHGSSSGTLYGWALLVFDLRDNK